MVTSYCVTAVLTTYFLCTYSGFYLREKTFHSFNMGGPGAYTVGVALFAAIGTFLFVSTLGFDETSDSDVLWL